MFSLGHAKGLRYGQLLYHVIHRAPDGYPRAFRVCGKVKTWDEQPNRVRVPLQWHNGALAILNENNLWQFRLNVAEAMGKEEMTLFTPTRKVVFVNDSPGRLVYMEEITFTTGALLAEYQKELVAKTVQDLIYGFR